MAAITIRWEGNGLQMLREATQTLGATRGTRAYARAVNHTGTKAYTQIRRTLAKQVGLPVGRTESLGRLKKRGTFGAAPSFEIRSSGAPLSLQQHFRSRQTQKGVRASSPYGKSSLYRSAFLVPRWNNEVFWRTGESRFPVKRAGGPHVPREMVRYDTAEIFRSFVAAHLPKRVAHEIHAVTRGVVS